MITLGFTRPASKLPASVREAEALGFRVLAAPSLEVIHGDRSEFERLERCISEGVPVVFTSTTSVDHCLMEFGSDFPKMVSGCTTLAIGPGTAERMVSGGIRVDAVSEEHSSYGLVDEIGRRFPSGRIAVVRSDSGTDVISKGAAGPGWHPEEIAAYKLRACEVGPEMSAIMDAIADGGLDCMAFTSPMSASSFFGNMKDRFGDGHMGMMRSVGVAAIGRPTAERLSSLGRPPDMVPERSTFTDMLSLIRQRYARIPHIGLRSDPSSHKLYKGDTNTHD